MEKNLGDTPRPLAKGRSVGPLHSSGREFPNSLMRYLSWLRWGGGVEATAGDGSSPPTLLVWLGRLLISSTTALWMGFIFYLSSMESPPGVFSWLGFLRDIVAHLGLYWVLGCLGLLSVWSWKAALPRRLSWGLLVAALGSLYGILDEYHQSFVPGRSASSNDMLIDAVGMVAGVVTIRWLAQLYRRWEL